MREQEKIRLAGDRGWIASPSRWNEEEKARRLGLNIPAAELARMKSTAVRGAEFSAPSSADWRQYATPIRDQGACGSCVSFGVAAAVEAQAAIADKPGMDLSEAYLFFCGCGDCCNRGWQPGSAMDFCKAYGMIGEECFPYNDRDIPCSPLCNDVLVMVDGWHEEYNNRKGWVAENGPVAVAFMVYDDFFDYSGGVYRHTYGTYMGGHCVSLFGYDSEGWICKNSWGTSWGEDGWFRIAFGECGMDTLYPFWCVDGISFPNKPSPSSSPSESASPSPSSSLSASPSPSPEPPDGCRSAITKLFRW